MKERISTRLIAKGRWPRILRELGIPTKALNGRNGPCIFCGGKDRARFTDYKESGSYFCNQCGNRNGFKLLMDFRGWTFAEAAHEIDKLIATSALVSLSNESYQAYRDTFRYEIPKSTKDATVWLWKHHPERLESWLDRHDPELRWWLKTQEEDRGLPAKG